MPEAKVYKTSHASSPWQVSACLPGRRRVRKHFSNKADAEKHATRLNQQFNLEGAEGIHFGAEARADYSAAVRRLGAVGATLGDAVAFYLDKHAEGPAKPFGEAVGALIKAKLTANRRERTVKDLRSRLEFFQDAAQIETVQDVDPDAIADFLARPKIKPRTRNSYRAALTSFCNFCRRKGWMKGNPFEGIEMPTPDPVLVKVLTPVQVARLMTAAAKYKGGHFVRALVLRLLQGIRPAEVNRLVDSNIRASVITVEEGKTRGRRAVRHVPISPVSRGWLELYKDAPLAFTNTVWRRGFGEIKTRAGLGRVITPDILRKTWISYRLAEIKNDAQVAREAGNSAEIIYRHYFDLVDAEDVPRFGAFSVLKS